MPYVYSTATCSGTYVEYQKTPPISENKSSPGYNKAIRKIVINGGHGVATKHLFTPKGVVTQVSDDDLEFLLKNASFQRHVAAGFLTYDKKKVDPEKKIVNMAAEDGSAPLTPKDFEKGENGDETTKVFKGLPKSKI
jgi:hypothetical protein